MQDFIITTDTTSDLPEEYIKKHNIHVIPLYYQMDDIVYGDDTSLEPQDFYAKMRNGEMPTTMACNQDSVEKIFRNILDSGFDILHIAFSSALSSSCSAATVVGRDLSEEYPNNKIIVIDSLAASMGEGLIVHKAVTMRDNGKSIDEIHTYLEENKLHFCHQFTVDDLHHLHRGGRVSKATAIIGTIINVKPILHVSDEGELIPLSNVRGRKKSLNTLVDNMAASLRGYESENKTVFISHGDCLKDAQYVAHLVTERFGIKDILINYVSPTIGAHSGPGTVALFFFGSKR